MKRIVVAITGASGSIYGLRLVEELLKQDCRVTLLLTKAGLEVLRYETGLGWEGTTGQRLQLMRDYFGGNRHLEHLGCDDLFAAIASGSSGPRRGGHRPLLDGHRRAHRRRPLRQPHRAGRRRRPQGAPRADPGAARDPA